jgi:RNA polymerase sigma factor (sigma-70 family)
MDDSVAAEELLVRWRRGDQNAAAELYHRYARRLIALARSRLSSDAARRIDPEDVVQSVYRSFFVAARDGQYQVQTGDGLWYLLVTITMNKLRDQVERLGTRKRDIQRERSFGSEESLFGIEGNLFARDPSPAEAAALVEQLEQVMRELDPLQCRMLELRLQGHSVADIAAATQRCEQTVRRLLGKIKEQLQKHSLEALPE